MESERLQLYKSLVSEISKGMEQVKQLKVSSSNNEQEGVLERMLSSHEEALLILTGRAPQGQCQSGISSISDPPGSSTRGLLKRKNIYSLKIQASGAFSELPPEDGYSWRKYAQKDIVGSKYPRGYYRCIHRHSNPCLAKKQVQRSDDGTIFEVTYRGRHTCPGLSKIIEDKQEQCVEDAKSNQDSSQTFTMASTLSII